MSEEVKVSATDVFEMRNMLRRYGIVLARIERGVEEVFGAITGKSLQAPEKEIEQGENECPHYTWQGVLGARLQCEKPEGHSGQHAASFKVLW